MIEKAYKDGFGMTYVSRGGRPGCRWGGGGGVSKGSHSTPLPVHIHIYISFGFGDQLDAIRRVGPNNL